MENARDYLHCEHWPSNEHNGLSLNKFSLRFIYVITCIHIHCASVMRTRWVNAIVATFNAKSRARCEYGLMRVYVLGSKNCGRLNFNFNWSILKIYFCSSLSHRQHSIEPRQTKLKISLTFVFICLVSVGFNWRQSVCVCVYVQWSLVCSVQIFLFLLLVDDILQAWTLIMHRFGAFFALFAQKNILLK